MTLKEITVPDIGDFDGVEIIEVLVAVGDVIQAEDSLITVESDKASMEIPSSDSGTVVEVKVAIGDTIAEGSLLLMLDVSDTANTTDTDNAEIDTASNPEAAANTEDKTTQAVTHNDSHSTKDSPAITHSPSSGSTIETLYVPDIGDFDSVEIIEVLVAPGDVIEAEQSLITVESDKASMEIPATQGGTVVSVMVKVGDSIAEGSALITLNSPTHSEMAEASVTNPANQATSENTTPVPASHVMPSSPASQSTTNPKASPTSVINEVAFSKAYASPSIRRFARELGVDLSLVKGSGRKGRLVKDDIKTYIKTELTKPKAATSGGGIGIAPMPEIDFSQWGEVESIALSKINKITGEVMHRNWVSIPHITQYDEADITEMEAFRKSMSAELKEQGIKITPLAFIMKAVVATLKAYPRFNTSLAIDGKTLIRKHYYHIGVAVDTPDGLVVPVIRDVDKKSITQLSAEIVESAVKARNKKLTPSDMQGGCFTISSLGGIGGTKFTPIINAPEVAILGVSKSSIQPVWNGNEFEPKLMLPLSLSYDHRVIDGANGARFTTYLAQALSDIRRLLL